MKRINVFFMLGLISTISTFAQNTTVELESFNELKAYDQLNITLSKSNENKAVVSGDDQDDVKLVVDEGRLKIKMEVENFMDGNETNITLYYSENLNLIDANEGSKIESNEAIDSKYLVLRAQEGAELQLTVNSNNLETKAVSGGKITVSGSSPNQDVLVRSGGEYHAKGLNSAQTDVTVFAGGKAYITASEFVDANVTAGGTIEIYGNPDKVKEDRTLGGSIVIK